MMSNELLNRIEQQAVEIAELKKERVELQSRIEEIPTLVDNALKRTWKQMANASCNCGPNSGCSLARRMLDNSQ
jgi:hypothetical protein